MAYFQNKREQDDYRNDHCRSCQHSADCAVWRMHERWNDEQVSNHLLAEALDTLIPRVNGHGNGPCLMHVEAGELARRPSW